MDYEIPNDLKMSEREEQKTSEKLNTLTRGMAKNFLTGLFFFITIPIFIYKKIKLKGGKNRNEI